MPSLLLCRRVHADRASAATQAMELIAAFNVQGYHEYFQRTHNTICGRNPIAVLLHVRIGAPKHAAAQRAHAMSDASAPCRAQAITIGVEAGQMAEPILAFLHYAHSNRVTSANDSSVSYAAASLVLNDDESDEADADAEVVGLATANAAADGGAGEAAAGAAAAASSSASASADAH